MTSSTAGPPSIVAVLADIHGNQLALEAVLADLETIGVEQIFVAGDLVGFGPNPVEVVDALVAWKATIIRGNHEKDYVAVYGTVAEPPEWRADPRLPSMIHALELIGPERRAFLAALPDRYAIDAATLVVHGSPRHVRDAVTATTPVAELEAMFFGESASLAFVGHTHKPVVRSLTGRRIVNAGSVGLPLDGDPRACYAVASREAGSGPGCWRVEHRRVAYDVEAAADRLDTAFGEVDPRFVAIISHELRTGRNVLGPWLRATADLAPEQLDRYLERFLVAK